MLAVAYLAEHDGVTLATHDLSTTHTLLSCPRPGLRSIDHTPWNADQSPYGKSNSHPPQAVESYPTPYEVVNADADTRYLFLPSHFRLAISLEHALSIRDVRDSSLLLKTDFGAYSWSFSPNGSFFACMPTVTGEAHIWKESPAGYVLHQKFAIGIQLSARVCLSPNGESILVSTYSKIDLRHTEYSILPSYLEIDSSSFIL